MNHDEPNKVNNANEVSVKDLLIKIRSGFRYLKSKWVAIVVFSLIGALLGLLYSATKKIDYKAVCTFVLDDANSGSTGGGYAGLASMMGISMGGSGGGIFQGDNILELYKSRSMIEKALLTNCVFQGKEELLIDRFIDINDLRTKEKGDHKIGAVSFKGNPDNFSRKQDSVITSLVDVINQKTLTVSKPEKSLNIIGVEVVSRDELFSKYFNDKIVETVNDFYVQTKTKKAFQNMQILQRQADSVKLILHSSINGVASANDADPNANPMLSQLKVGSQKKQVDVQANTVIYGQMLQNLELAKISLRQEMPLIQVIDKPVLPLSIIAYGWLKGVLIGTFVFAFLTISWLVLKKSIQTILS